MTTTASGRSKGSAPARADRADALDAIRADDRGEFADGGVQAGEASEHIPVGLSGSQDLKPPSATAFMGADVEMERELPTVRSAGHGFAPPDVPLTVLDDQLAAPGCRQ